MATVDSTQIPNRIWVLPGSLERLIKARMGIDLGERGRPGKTVFVTVAARAHLPVLVLRIF